MSHWPCLHEPIWLRRIGDSFQQAKAVAHSIPATRLIRFMKDIIWEKGKPTNIRCDNGPEFISYEFQDWCDGNGIKILYTQPGCPTQNSCIERFNGSYRRAVLDSYIFRTLDDVREVTEKMDGLLQQRKTPWRLKQPRSNGISVGKNWVILYTLNRS